MDSKEIKRFKGVVQDGETVYSIINREGKIVLGPLDFDRNIQDGLISFMERMSLEIDQQLSLYECKKVATSNHINYRKYIASDSWKRKAKEAKERAGNHCQVCYSNSNLEAHHRTYMRLGHEKPEDITILCGDCHKLFHDNGRVKGGRK